ncbi:MAG: hypothetical protein ACTSRW_10400 [Candidatus Helarchaeota archaeon]
MSKEKAPEIKRGKEITKEISYKEKLKICNEFYHMKQFAIFAFCLKKGIDPREYLDFQYEIYDKLKYSTYNNPIALAAIRKMPTSFLISQFRGQIFENWQPFQKLKDFTLITDEKLSQIELKNCKFRKMCKKYSKKTKIDVPDDISCYFCELVYGQGADLGFEIQIEKTKDGCVIKIKG